MKKGLWLVLLTGFGWVSKAQPFEQALQNYHAALPPEKLFIHFDKEQYVAGETIWFKAYLYSDGRPSAYSSNLFVQLLNDQGHEIRNWRFPVMGAVAKGSLRIPDSLPTAGYWLRAVTPYQLNGPEEFLYRKPLFISHPLYKAPVASPAGTGIDLQFFPESGHLVHGILTVVGFKATDAAGRPASVKGLIKTDDGSTVAPFQTGQNGMGRVQFKPVFGKKYSAEWGGTGGARSVPLPGVEDEGINLKISDEKGGKKFQLSRSVKEGGKFDNLRVVAQINQHLVYETEISFEDYPSVIGHLITDSLPSGILHFTVFSKEGLPLAERLTFVQNREYEAETRLSGDSISLERRGANLLTLEFADSVAHSCSVSVTTADQAAPSDNIWSRLLLTSDIRGTIHQPGWYFTQRGDSVRLALDNLLLTQGWTRFSWTRVLAGELPVRRIDDSPLLALRGLLTDDKGGQPIKDGILNIYMEAADSSTRNLEWKPDESGRVGQDSLLFEGNARLYYNWLDKNGKPKPAQLRLHTDSLALLTGQTDTAWSRRHLLPPHPATPDPASLELRFRRAQDEEKEAKELETVTVQAKSNRKPLDMVNEKYATGVFRTQGKENLDLVTEPVTDKSINAIDYIKNRIQQLEIQRGTFVNRKNMSLMSGQNWTVGIFINEVPADMNQLRILRAMDLALVKFYEAGFVGVGSTFPGGALAVYTKEKDTQETKPDKWPFVTVSGYSVTKEFYQPPVSSAAPDNRTTLYWNPDLYTGADGKPLLLRFNHNDQGKGYRVVIQGFDARGKLVYVERVVE